MVDIVDNRFQKLVHFDELKRGDAFNYVSDLHIKLDDTSAVNLNYMFVRKNMKPREYVMPVHITITVNT